MNWISQQEKTQPTSLTENLTVLVYGEPFIGKTTFAATWPKPIIISTDGNANRTGKDNIVITQTMQKTTTSGAKVPIHGWEVFKEIVLELGSDTEHETIVIDLFSHVVDLCRTYMFAKHNLTDESDMGYGKGYKLIKTELWPVIRQLKALNKNIIFITHVKTYDGEIKPNLSQSVFTDLTSLLDLVGMVNKINGEDGKIQRVFETLSTSVMSGNRLNLPYSRTWPTHESLIHAIKQANNQK